MLQNVITFIKNDWAENKIRCVAEIFAWVLSIVCSVTMAFTLPNPPFLILYPLFITQCAIFAWAAYTRKSTGMLANYALLVTIDVIALIRLISLQIPQPVL
jgi:hypothetical protein